jgi:hypothetical protein
MLYFPYKWGKRCFYSPAKNVENRTRLLLEENRAPSPIQAATAVRLVLSNPFDLAHW